VVTSDTKIMAKKGNVVKGIQVWVIGFQNRADSPIIAKSIHVLPQKSTAHGNSIKQENHVAAEHRKGNNEQPRVKR
jgi:hypothetical protein